MNRNLTKIICLLLIAFSLTTALNSPVFADPGDHENPHPISGAVDDSSGAAADAGTTTKAKVGIGLDDDKIKAKLPSNLPRLGLEGKSDPVEVVDSILLNYVVTPIFFLAGGVAIIVILYSAFRLVIARGEEEGVTAAKKALIWGIVGLGLVMLAFTIVSNIARIILGLV